MKVEALKTRFRYDPVSVETQGVYEEYSAVIISESGRRITEATGESKEILRLEQRLGLVTQRSNAFSIFTAVRETNMVPAACLIHSLAVVSHQH